MYEKKKQKRRCLTSSAAAAVVVDDAWLWFHQDRLATALPTLNALPLFLK
jgi:hypothetical protein